jgi:hypothetical protein
MSRRSLTLAAAALTVAASLALASDESKPTFDSTTPGGGHQDALDSVNARFRSDRSCQEMTDGCLVCIREADGHPGCSFPGIACAPSGWRCTKTLAESTDSPEGRAARRH